MPDTDAIDELLTRAGMLMEDASARLVSTGEPAVIRVSILYGSVEALIDISRAVDAQLTTMRR